MKRARLTELGTGKRFKLHASSPFVWERDRERDTFGQCAMHAVSDEGKVEKQVIHVPDMPVLVEPIQH